MKAILYLSDLMIPLVLFFIIGKGMAAGRPVYDDFITGAKSGIKTVVEILPTIIGLMTAVSVLRASGFLDAVGQALGGFFTRINLQGELVPLILVRMFSASAANGLVADIFNEFGADSSIGITASIIMGCTETAFYTMSVYYMAVKIKKTRYTLPGALLTTFAGIAASIVLAGLM